MFQDRTRVIVFALTLFMMFLAISTASANHVGSIELLSIGSQECQPPNINLQYSIAISVLSGETWDYENSDSTTFVGAGPLQSSGGWDSGGFEMDGNSQYWATTTIYNGGNMVAQLNIVFDCTGKAAGEDAEVTVNVFNTGHGAGTDETVSDSDPDGDGLSGAADNCPHDFNPDQEDGWGSNMGDTCDTDWYNMTGIGLAGFKQKSGKYHLHGNCTYMADGDPRCPEVAIFDPAGFEPDAMPMEITSDMAGTWSVWVYFLYSSDGVDVYQVNVYSTNPPQPDTLLDDRLEIHISGDSWQWYQRGGNPKYNGN